MFMSVFHLKISCFKHFCHFWFHLHVKRYFGSMKYFSEFFIARCSDPSRSTNAKVVGNEFYHGKEVEFVCKKDYVHHPKISKKLICDNGKWSGSIPLCKGILI